MSCAHRQLILASPIAILALGACSETDSESGAGPVVIDASPTPEPAEWLLYRGDRNLSGIAAGTLSAEPVRLWTYMADGAVTSSPVITDGVVFVGADDYKLHAIDFETGTGLWTAATEDIIEAPPLILGDRVILGSNDFFVYAFDRLTGAELWKATTDDKVLGSANWFVDAEGRDRIVIGSYDSRLYCFDPETGATVWTYQSDNYINGTPAIDGGSIVFGGCDSAVHVVGLDGKGIAKHPFDGESYIGGSVCALDGVVYFGHYGKEFLALDLDTGETVWSIRSRTHPFFSSPAVTDDRVVFGGRDKQMHCVDRATGEPIWSYKTRRKVDGSPVVCDGKVVFGSGDGVLYMLALADGAELWTYEVGPSIFSSPAVVDGRIVIGANDGSVLAFGPASALGQAGGGQ